MYNYIVIILIYFVINIACIISILCITHIIHNMCIKPPRLVEIWSARMFKRCCIFFFFITLFCFQTVGAYQITSPFGWRPHPVLGGQRFHAGIDIALDYGDPVPATENGIVEYAGPAGGYGNVVYLNHAGGRQTRYGHNQEVLVRTGQTVTKGQIISLAGSTGWSTGPHLHLEYRINGDPVDPIPYLQAQGWDVSYGAGGSYDIPGFSDYNEVPWNLESFFEIGETARKILEGFSQKCTDGLALLRDEALWLLFTLMAIDLALTIMVMGFTVSWRDYLLKLFKFGFIVFLVAGWATFINDFILSFFTTTASLAFDPTESVIGRNISDPSLIMQKGVFLIKPAFNYVSAYTGLRLVANIVEVFLALFLGLASLFCFFLIGISVTLVYLEFYFYSLLTVLAMPFSVISPLKFVGERGIGAVVNAGLRLMAVSVVIAIFIPYIENLQPINYSFETYIKVLLACILLVFLTIRIPKAVVNFLGGGVPRL